MTIDFRDTWAKAKAALLKEMPQIQDWEAVDLEGGCIITLTGTPQELTQGQKSKLTRRIRDNGLSNWGWRYQSGGVVTSVVDLAPSFTETVAVEGEVQVKVVRDAGNPQDTSAVDAVGPIVLTVEPAPAAPAHDRFNPSSWGYFERCPSYKNRIDEEESEFAAAGTRYHLIIETGNPSHGKDDEERYYAAQTIQFRDNTLLQWGLTPENREDFKEIRLPIQLPSYQAFGTLDHLSISKYAYPEGPYAGQKLAVAMDWKYGLTPVDDAEVNAQALAYQLGVFQKHPDVGIIIFYFVLPRQNIVTSSTVTRAEHYAQMLLRGETIYRRHIERAGEEFGPSPSLCEWCGNLSSCPAITNTVLTLARRYQGSDSFFDIPEQVHGSQMNDPEVVARLFVVADIAETWSKGIRNRANQMRFIEGLELPGLKDVYKSPNRTVTNPPLALALLARPQSVGLDADPVISEEEFLACVSKLSITDLLAVVATKTPEGMTKKDFEQYIEQLLRDHGALSGGGEEGKIGYLQIDRKAHKNT